MGHLSQRLCGNLAIVARRGYEQQLTQELTKSMNRDGARSDQLGTRPQITRPFRGSFVIIGGMFRGPIDPDKYLYHYTRKETAIERILPNMQLLLSPFTEMADPRESKNWVFNFPGSKGLDTWENLKLQNEVNEAIRKQCYALCLTRDDRDKLRIPVYDPFGRGFARSRMWAQYAGRHTGVCLILDRDALVQEVKDSFAHLGDIYCESVGYADRSLKMFDACAIEYDDIKKRGLERVAKNHIKSNIKYLFFQKVTDWETEFEYRAVLISSDSLLKYISIEESLKGIVVGEDFPDPYMACLEGVHDEYGVQIGKMQWNNGDPTCNRILPKVLRP